MSYRILAQSERLRAIDGRTVWSLGLVAFWQTCRTMSLVGVREQRGGERALVDDVTGEVLATVVPVPGLIGRLREKFAATTEKERARQGP